MARQLVQHMITANLIRSLQACANKDSAYATRIKVELAKRGILA